MEAGQASPFPGGGRHVIRETFLKMAQGAIQAIPPPDGAILSSESKAGQWMMEQKGSQGEGLNSALTAQNGS